MDKDNKDSKDNKVHTEKKDEKAFLLDYDQLETNHDHKFQLQLKGSYLLQFDPVNEAKLTQSSRPKEKQFFRSLSVYQSVFESWFARTHTFPFNRTLMLAFPIKEGVPYLFSKTATSNFNMFKFPVQFGFPSDEYVYSIFSSYRYARTLNTPERNQLVGILFWDVKKECDNLPDLFFPEKELTQQSYWVSIIPFGDLFKEISKEGK